MSRPLMLFEKAVFLEGGARANIDSLSKMKVCEEVYAQKRSLQSQWFNTDFFISLIKDRSSMNTHGSCIPSYPNSLGAEYFVVLDTNESPVSLELLDGESISRKSFDNEIKSISLLLKTIPYRIQELSVDSASVFRVARLSSCIAFILSSSTEVSNLTNQNPQNLNNKNCNVNFYCGEKDIMLDGIIFD